MSWKSLYLVSSNVFFITLYISIFLYYLDCGFWPNIENGFLIEKEVEIISHERLLTVSGMYVCDEGFVYTKPNDTVTCTDPSLELDVGMCVKGKLLYCIPNGKTIIITFN